MDKIQKPAPPQLDLEIEELEQAEKAGKYGITTTNRRCVCTTHEAARLK